MKLLDVKSLEHKEQLRKPLLTEDGTVYKIKRSIYSKSWTIYLRTLTIAILDCQKEILLRRFQNNSSERRRGSEKLNSKANSLFRDHAEVNTLCGIREENNDIPVFWNFIWLFRASRRHLPKFMGQSRFSCLSKLGKHLLVTWEHQLLSSEIQ